MVPAGRTSRLHTGTADFTTSKRCRGRRSACPHYSITVASPRWHTQNIAGLSQSYDIQEQNGHTDSLVQRHSVKEHFRPQSHSRFGSDSDFHHGKMPKAFDMHCVSSHSDAICIRCDGLFSCLLQGGAEQGHKHQPTRPGTSSRADVVWSTMSWVENITKAVDVEDLRKTADGCCHFHAAAYLPKVANAIFSAGVSTCLS